MVYQVRHSHIITTITIITITIVLMQLSLSLLSIHISPLLLHPFTISILYTDDDFDNNIGNIGYKQSKKDKFMDEGKGMFFASMMLDGEEEDDDDNHAHDQQSITHRNSVDGGDFDCFFYYRKATGEAAEKEDLLALNVVRSLSTSTDSPQISPHSLQYSSNNNNHHIYDHSYNNHHNGNREGEGEDGSGPGLSLSRPSTPEYNSNFNGNTSSDSNDDNDNNDDDKGRDPPFAPLTSQYKKESFAEKGDPYIDRNLFTGTGFFYTGLLESVAGSQHPSNASLAQSGQSGSESDLLRDSWGASRDHTDRGQAREGESPEMSPGMIRVGSTHVSLNYLTALHENEFRDEDTLPQEPGLYLGSQVCIQGRYPGARS